MSELITISVSKTFRERFERLVNKGRRSEFIVQSVNKELDALELAASIRRDREQWMSDNIVPILREILKGKNEYEIMDYSDPPRIGFLMNKVKEAVCEISEEHMMWAIIQVRNERRSGQ
jgi:Arc/MetJ-type ribon-helix-helix transcriptional regulator